ncbi:MAG: hypothetical protein ACXV8Q_04730 [Methylobacter sp.]
MLEGLLAQIAKTTSLPTMTVPPVPSRKTQREPLQPTYDGAVPWVPPVPPQKTKVETKNINPTLSAVDRQKILFYLDSIRETDQILIDELLERCRTHREALAWVLNLADKTRGKHRWSQAWCTCRSCANFKSYNTHGGGAGQCSIGVWSAGICRWSDDRHQCDEYQGRT